jgi:glycosyltransferase involved in cell wall biosynthesis
MATVPVTVVSNARDLGFPAAINQGLSLACGEYLVLLDNDFVVTHGWLDQLIALVNAVPRGQDGAGVTDISEGTRGSRVGVSTARGLDERSGLGFFDDDALGY